MNLLRADYKTGVVMMGNYQSHRLGQVAAPSLSTYRCRSAMNIATTHRSRSVTNKRKKEFRFVFA
ncbi:MAG: hypothetical protein M3342_18050 [Bacteroidota bacterium]|nr:hypothetical protein [Bacteroidota bacterium]